MSTKSLQLGTFKKVHINLYFCSSLLMRPRTLKMANWPVCKTLFLTKAFSIYKQGTEFPSYESPGLGRVPESSHNILHTALVSKNTLERRSEVVRWVVHKLRGGAAITSLFKKQPFWNLFFKWAVSHAFHFLNTLFDYYLLLLFEDLRHFGEIVIVEQWGGELPEVS